MTKAWIHLSLLAIACGSLTSGCASHKTAAATETQATVTTTTTYHEPGYEHSVYPTPTGRQVTVYEESPPPPPPMEVFRSPRDQDGQTSAPGYWAWNNNHWVWTPGHPESPPRAGAVWVPGQWTKNPSGNWELTPGHWQ